MIRNKPTIATKIPTRMDLAYIAGFFDGEGCVGIKKPAPRSDRGTEGVAQKQYSHTPYVTIAQVRPAVLRMIQEFFGGNLHFGKECGKNGIWHWQRGGTKSCFVFLKAIRPYLVVKTAEVDLVLEAFSEMTFAKKHGTPARLIEKREIARLAVIAARNQWKL